MASSRQPRFVLCQYGHCDGGQRLAQRRRAAQTAVVIGAKRWQACEICANLLIRQARGAGLKVSQEPRLDGG